jgi:hypothetical protein
MATSVGSFHSLVQRVVTNRIWGSGRPLQPGRYRCSAFSGSCGSSVRCILDKLRRRKYPRSLARRLSFLAREPCLVLMRVNYSFGLISDLMCVKIAGRRRPIAGARHWQRTEPDQCGGLSAGYKIDHVAAHPHRSFRYRDRACRHRPRRAAFACIPVPAGAAGLAQGGDRRQNRGPPHALAAVEPTTDGATRGARLMYGASWQSLRQAANVSHHRKTATNRPNE